jgi:hypothetical protein
MPVFVEEIDTPEMSWPWNGQQIWSTESMHAGTVAFDEYGAYKFLPMVNMSLN